MKSAMRWMLVLVLGATTTPALADGTADEQKAQTQAGTTGDARQDTSPSDATKDADLGGGRGEPSRGDDSATAQSTDAKQAFGQRFIEETWTLP
jgi:hypothetical protein